MRRIIGVLLFALTSFAAPAYADRPPIGPGSNGDDVKVAQFILKSQGWVLPVDGVFGARTTKVVKAFQRVNGLYPDGLIGPITWDALESAVRVEAPAPQPSPPSEPCAEMAWFAARAGLPDVVDVRYGTGGFDDQPTREEAGFAEQAIGRRESGCNNSAGNSCCGGWWGLHQGNITAPGYRAGFAACGINSRSDYQGPTPEQKTASACAAAVLYNYWLAHPGQPWPWRL